MKRARKLLAVLLMLVFVFSMAVTVSAAGNVVYTNGTEGSGWPYKSAYINTITLEGVTVKNYTWSGDTCDVVLANDTADDAEITFNVAKGGTTMWVNRMSMTLNGTSISSSGTVQLVDGKLDGVKLYVDATFKSGTKTFNFSIAEPNNLPALADSSKTGETAEVVGGETYTLGLASLFTDADAADTLSYNVSINGADPVAAEVDEDGNYSYTQKVAGTYTLVFTATDSKEDTSTDTYTTTLTVKNSEKTYDMTVNVPSDITPSFAITTGYDSSYQDTMGDALTAQAGTAADGLVPYTISVPENVERISVRADGWGGMAIDAAKDSTVSLRKVKMSAEDMFGTAVDATVTVTYDETYKAVAGETNCFLLKAAKEYIFTATPSNTTSFATATKTDTLSAGSDTAEMTALVSYSNQKTVTTPTGADAQFFVYNKYYDNTEYVKRGVVDNENGTSTHYFSGCKTPAGGGSFIYRVTYPGHITKAGWTNGNVTVTYSGSEIGPKDRVDYSTSTETNAGIAEDSVLLNVNSQNFLSMAAGDSKVLKAYRAWEIIPVSYNNWIVEPDFHFNVVYESESGVVSLENKANNMTGGKSWQTLTANKAGTAIIEVTYDAIDVRGGQYNGVYGASDPARTGLVVVQVGGGDTSVNFGIDCLASQGSVVYEKSTAKSWDAEFDTLYFTGDSGELKLSPTASGTIQNVAVSNDKGNTWTTLSAAEGVYTATITSGNNLIKVTTDSGVAYQVVRGDKVSVTVEELAGNENNDGDGTLESGEVARVTIDGLHSPIPKMAGNYNPGFGGNTDGYSSHHLSYLQDGTRIQGAGSQYNWLTATNYIDVTLPDEGTSCTLEDGCIGVGIIGLTGFANGGDSHRNIPDSGCTMRDSKTTFNTRSMLPEITIDIVEKPKYEVILTEGDGYTLTASEGSESPVMEGGSFSFTLEVAEGYTAGDDFAVKANDTALTADENGVYTIENITEAQTVTVEGVAADGTPGDVNGDDKIDSGDAVLVLRYAEQLTTAINMTTADVNGDGEVTSDDALQILKYAAGLISEFTTSTSSDNA